MEKSKYFRSVLKGSAGSLLVCFLGIVILSAVMTKLTLNSGIYNAVYVIISLIGLSIGSIAGAKKNECRGWLVGFGVATTYYFILYIFTGVLSGEWAVNMMFLIKYIVCAAVGILSGMLGMNI